MKVLVFQLGGQSAVKKKLMGHPDVVLLYYGPVTIFIGVVNFTFNPRAPTKNGCNFACIQLLGYTD